MSLNDCRIIELPKISDPRGNLTFIEGGRHIPFEIKRVYYLYDVPGGAERGSHGHRKLQQFIVAMSGSFDVILDDGFETKTIHMKPFVLRPLCFAYDVERYHKTCRLGQY